MLIISIIANSFLTWGNVWLRFASKLALLPLIVGVGFEFIRYAGGHSNVFTKIVSAPGLWMQRITTKEPDDAQLEVALAALKNAVPAEFGGIVQPSGVLNDDGTTSPGPSPAPAPAPEDAPEEEAEEEAAERAEAPEQTETADQPDQPELPEQPEPPEQPEDEDPRDA